MAYNKFIKKDGEVLLDLTGDTVTADKLAEGVTAHNASGEAITGTADMGGGESSRDTCIIGVFGRSSGTLSNLSVRYNIDGDTSNYYLCTGTTSTGGYKELTKGTKIRLNIGQPEYDSYFKYLKNIITDEEIETYIDEDIRYSNWFELTDDLFCEVYYYKAESGGGFQ